jgi:hypothetical protein
MRVIAALVVLVVMQTPACGTLRQDYDDLVRELHIEGMITNCATQSDMESVIDPTISKAEAERRYWENNNCNTNKVSAFVLGKIRKYRGYDGRWFWELQLGSQDRTYTFYGIVPADQLDK